jgi:hypothetical protein
MRLRTRFIIFAAILACLSQIMFHRFSILAFSMGQDKSQGEATQAQLVQQKQAEPPAIPSGKVLFESKVLRIELSDTSPSGIQWNFGELKSSLDETPQGKYVHDTKSGAMQIESLAIADFSKFLKYLERFGKVEILYAQSVSAAADKGQTVRIQD